MCYVFKTEWSNQTRLNLKGCTRLPLFMLKCLPAYFSDVPTQKKRHWDIIANGCFEKVMYSQKHVHVNLHLPKSTGSFFSKIVCNLIVCIYLKAQFRNISLNTYIISIQFQIRHNNENKLVNSMSFYAVEPFTNQIVTFW